MTKEEAITILSDIRSEYNCFSHIEGGRYHALSMGIKALKERKHGKWERAQEQPYFRKHFDIVVCSCCHNRGNKKWNFCPNCGADMRGDDNGT